MDLFISYLSVPREISVTFHQIKNVHIKIEAPMGTEGQRERERERGRYVIHCGKCWDNKINQSSIIYSQYSMIHLNWENK
jgi:hypothetical protein